MEWTDLDQAYLDIFGTHPDLSEPTPTLRIVAPDPDDEQ